MLVAGCKGWGSGLRLVGVVGFGVFGGGEEVVVFGGFGLVRREFGGHGFGGGFVVVVGVGVFEARLVVVMVLVLGLALGFGGAVGGEMRNHLARRKKAMRWRARG